MWQDRLKTGLMVVLLTGLVWFFADQADMDSKTVSLHLSVQPPSANYRVMAQAPEPLQFDVTFKAPRGVIREIEQEMRTRLLNATFTLDRPAGDARFAHQDYESAKVIGQLDVIRQRGLAVVSAHPASFSVDLDTVVRRTMRVRPEFGELVVEKEEPKPAAVDVILPSRMADELADDWLRVDVAPYVDASKPDVWQSKTVELKWPQADARAALVHFEPPSFEVRMKLKDTTEQKKFQSVQVGLLFVSPEVSNKYRVEYDSAEFRPDVTVAGPRQVIDNLSKDNVKPFVLYVEVYSSDEASVGQPITRPVKIQGLDPSVRVISPLRDVRFTLQDKAQRAGG